jgi:hypothetical protein
VRTVLAVLVPERLIPFDVGVGSVAFWSVKHGGDACRGDEG